MARRSHSVPPAKRALSLGCGMGLLDGGAAARRAKGLAGLERRRTIPVNRRDSASPLNANRPAATDVRRRTSDTLAPVPPRQLGGYSGGLKLLLSVKIWHSRNSW